VQHRLLCQPRLPSPSAWRCQAIRYFRRFPCQATLPSDSPTPRPLTTLCYCNRSSSETVVAWHSLCSLSESDGGLLPPHTHVMGQKAFITWASCCACQRRDSDP
jgi:hypothetical protein